MPDHTVVTGPGVYSLPIDVYHADPVPGGSLSSTGARKLLPPSCPAQFKHWRDNPEPPSEVFDLGTAAHRLVLGVGPELVRVRFEEWRTNAVKAEVAEVRDRGAVPLRPSAYDTVHAMAEALWAHPFAGRLFTPGTGLPEQTLIWDANPPEVSCRALVDWLPNPTGGRLILPDYKSCVSAAPDDVSKAVARYGYHIQGAFYLAGLRALGLADERARFVLVMQEKTPPYLVTVAEPDDEAMRLAAIRVEEALLTYAECTATGRWPGYSDDVVPVALPPWETKELREDTW